MGKGRIKLETYNDLVAAIYDAANDPTQWNEFLALFTQAFNGHGAALRLLDPESYFPNFSATHGYDEAFTQEYTDHYYQTDITNPILASQEAGTVQSRSALLADKDFLGTEYYQDFARKWGLYDVLGSYFIKQADCTARIGVHRDNGRPSFSEEDKRLMALLVPHLQRAFNISRRIQSIKAQGEAGTDILNQLPFGLVLIDRAGRVVMVNRQAEAMSNQGCGISIKGEGLYADSPRDAKALQTLIRQAIQENEDQACQGGATAITRPTSPIPLSILITPLNPSQSLFGFADPHVAAAVFISDPEHQRQIPPEILCGLYGLTKSEARLATELAQGRSLDEIADTYHVSKHTLRTQLKSIFSKTGLKRQPDLIRLILGGPAILNF